jgi:hypothetical protein
MSRRIGLAIGFVSVLGFVCAAQGAQRSGLQRGARGLPSCSTSTRTTLSMSALRGKADIG